MGKRNKKRYFQQRNLQKSSNEKPLNKTDRDNYESGSTNQNEVEDSLREDQVCITEYINKEGGFQGILKSRFSDFHVNEIDLSGQILQLNDLSVPEQKELSAEEAKLAKEELGKLMSAGVWNQMDKLKDAPDNGENPKESVLYVDVSNLDKEQRTHLHKVIQKLYENKLVSSSVNPPERKEGDKRVISVMKAKNYNHNKWPFPQSYVYFLVHKENLDSDEVALSIAHKLNLKPWQVSYCDMKDKRAKTTQRFCIKKVFPSKIANVAKLLNGVTVGNFSFKKNVLKFGDLHGNRFQIAIRNIVGEREQIETSLMNVKNQGFINYFGLKRFGNCSEVPWYEIGVALLKADYKLACELIMRPRNIDVPFLKDIRKMWWNNRNSKTAAAKFRSNEFIEKKLLDGLAKFGENEYAAALRKIPRNMLVLYPHAFQSLIFNNVASKRIKEFGLSLIPGDLVYIKIYKEDEEVLMDSTELTEQDDVNKKCNDNEETWLAGIEQGYKFSFKRKIKTLTEENIASGFYTIYDVVLPLPGPDIRYPENIVGTWYKDLLEKYQLTMENLKHNDKMFTMAGAYRKFIVKPREMSWEFKSYSAPDETLILSDLELLDGKKLEDFKKATNDSKHEALLLDFQLPTATYASVMLRELLKCDTLATAENSVQQVQNVQKVKSFGKKRKAEYNEADKNSFRHTKL